MNHQKVPSVVSRRNIVLAMGATATGLYACGGGGDGSAIEAKPPTTTGLSIERFATSSSGAAAILKNQFGGTVALWADPSTVALTQGLYSQGGSSIRVFYDTNEQPTRIVNEKTREFLTVKVVDNSRTDYNLYTSAGAWMDGFAILSQPGGGHAIAKIVSSSSLEGKQINADLTGAVVASLSLIPVANSGLGSPISIVNSSVLLALSASVPKQYAMLNRLTDMLIGNAYAATAPVSSLVKGLGGVILIVGGVLGGIGAGGATAAALGLVLAAGTATSLAPLVAGALVIGGFALLLSARDSASRPLIQEALDAITGEAVTDFSRGSTSFDNTTAAISSYLSNDASMRGSFSSLSSIVSTVGSVTSAAASALTSVATSTFQQITSNPPLGLTNLAGLMVDSSGQTYQAQGTYQPSGNSYTFTATSGNNQANGSGTVGGNGTYSTTQNGVTKNGTVTSNQQPLGECRTQQSSGGQGAFTKSYDLGRDSGTFSLTYEMFSVPDALEVRSSSGAVLFSTGGLVSGSKTVNVPFSGGRIVFIVLSAPNQGTAWNYSLGCPA